jgi:hypothetical protein
MRKIQRIVQLLNFKYVLLTTQKIMIRKMIITFNLDYAC